MAVSSSEAYQRLQHLLPAHARLKLIDNQFELNGAVVKLRPQVAAAVVHFVEQTDSPSDLAAIKAALWNDNPLLPSETLNIQKVISDLNKAMQMIGVERDLIQTLKNPLSYQLDRDLWGKLMEPEGSEPPADDSGGRTPQQLFALLDFGNRNCRLLRRAEIVIYGPPPVDDFHRLIDAAIKQSCRCVILAPVDANREMRRAFPTKAGLEWRPVSTHFGAPHAVIFNAHLRARTECWMYSSATGRYYLSMAGTDAYQLADQYLCAGPSLQNEIAAALGRG